jgi:hypothetical protein
MKFDLNVFQFYIGIYIYFEQNEWLDAGHLTKNPSKYQYIVTGLLSCSKSYVFFNKRLKNLYYNVPLTQTVTNKNSKKK